MNNNTNNNTKPVYKPISPLDTNPFFAIVGYLICQFIVSSIVSVVLITILLKQSGLPYESASKLLTTNLPQGYGEEYLPISCKALGWGNTVGYVTSLIFVGFYTRAYWIEDFKRLKNKWMLLIIPVGLAFVGIMYGVDSLFELFSDSSANQSSIVAIYKYDGIATILPLVFIAPIVEELVYRKCIFKCLKNKPLYVKYLASIVFFVLPHMITTTSSFTSWILTCIPYVISAILLTTIYDRFKENVYASAFAHLCNNILALILLVI